MTSFYCVGGANVDVKCHIAGKAILATSNPGNTQSSVGGVARNLAHNLSLLGLQPKLITSLGDDAHGDMIRTACAGFEVRALKTSQPTGTYTAVMDGAGDLVIGVAAMETMAMLDVAFLTQALGDVAAGDFIVADANLTPEALLWLGQWAQARNAFFVLEPVSVAKSTHLLPVLQAELPVFLMSPNMAQLAALTGVQTLGEDDLGAACAALHFGGTKQKRVSYILVGLGPRGVFWSNGMRCGFQPSQVSALVDATGAGDAALAAALWALSGGVNLRESAIVGQYAAALTAASPLSVYPELSAALLLQSLH